MKTLKLDKPSKLTADITLEVRDAQCNFCGEENVKCVKGSAPLEVNYCETKDRWGYTIKDWEFTDYFFRPNRKLIIGLPLWEQIIVRKEYKTKIEDADICVNCITQLAKLIK